MKKKLNFFGIIVLAAVIVFSTAACSKNPFIGTWTYVEEGRTAKIIFTDSNFSLEPEGEQAVGGTYSYDGHTAILIGPDGSSLTVTISGKTFDWINGITFTKE